MVLSSPSDVTYASSECFREGFVYVLFCFVLNEGTSNAVGNIKKAKELRSLPCFRRFRNLNSNLNTCVADVCPLHKQKKKANEPRQRNGKIG